MNNPKDKFLKFLESLEIEADLKTALENGSSIILEDMTGTSSMASGIGGITPTIFKAPDFVKKAQIEENKAHAKRRFRGFLNLLPTSKKVKNTLTEGFDVLVESYNWIPSDPTQTYSMGGTNGAEMLGIPNRPLWDTYYPFKIAPGGSDAVDISTTGKNAMSGFDRTQAVNHPQVKYPQVKARTNKDVKKLIANADAQTPNDSNSGFYAPFWHYYNFFNSQNYF